MTKYKPLFEDTDKKLVIRLHEPRKYNVDNVEAMYKEMGELSNFYIVWYDDSGYDGEGDTVKIYKMTGEWEFEDDILTFQGTMIVKGTECDFDGKVISTVFWGDYSNNLKQVTKQINQTYQEEGINWYLCEKYEIV